MGLEFSVEKRNLIRNTFGGLYRIDVQPMRIIISHPAKKFIEVVIEKNGTLGSLDIIEVKKSIKLEAHGLIASREVSQGYFYSDITDAMERAKKIIFPRKVGLKVKKP